MWSLWCFVAVGLLRVRLEAAPKTRLAVCGNERSHARDKNFVTFLRESKENLCRDRLACQFLHVDGMLFVPGVGSRHVQVATFSVLMSAFTLIASLVVCESRHLQFILQAFLQHDSCARL